MPCRLSRRQVLRFLTLVLPAAAIGWKSRDVFDRERVCVHVYDPAGLLPAPLLRPAGNPDRRPDGGAVFGVGLPELILCRTSSRLLDLYPYFWPVAREEVRQLQDSVQLLYQKQTVAGKKDVDGMRTRVPAQHRPGAEPKSALAAIFTLNDGTRNVVAAVVDACRSMGVSELVVFKDPSRPPYLCSYASRQKGFKRPPPIG